MEQPGVVASFWGFLFACALVAPYVTTGCAAIPDRRYALRSVEFSGNRSLDADEIRSEIASRESPRFLGLFPGVIYEYEVFDRYVLERDLQRIERYYRARGFYHAKVRAGRVFYKSARQIAVEILIEEGPAMIVRRLDLHGLEGLPAPLLASAKLYVERSVGVGTRFEEKAFLTSEKELKTLLSNAGFAFVKTRRSADVDLSLDSASVGFWVELGPIAHIGEVRIEGLGSIPEPPVRRALALKPGDPYSSVELASAERALLELGVFGSVSVKPEINENTVPTKNPVVPILVRVEPSKLRSVRLGGGAEVDALRSEVHVTAAWEHLNFFGGLRRFTTELVPGAVLYPTHLPTFAAPTSVLPQVKLRSELREPGFLEPRTHGIVSAQGSIYPVLLSPDPIPGAPILGYRELRTSLGLERGYGKLNGLVSYNVQVNSPFAYLGTKDADLRTILVSYPAVTAMLDFRDSQVSPHVGAYFATTIQFAGLGGDAHDWKLQPEARIYLPVSRRVTFALRGNIGLLFPGNYGSTLERDALTKTSGAASRADWVRDLQIMFLRGFFSGGPASNRGYLPREIGPHGIVPFFNPGQTTAQIAIECAPTSPTFSAPICNLPLGGFTLWEASVELRFPIGGPIEGALFVDSSDVAAQRFLFRWRPHLSTGAGFRYVTPIGPVRLDIGYRVPGLQAPNSPDEGIPATILGAPIAVSLGIGESF
jgi:outer membrane protein insertion porin family/translocation and assembly module TamA